jgi:large subunit ribosomal protein L10
MQKEDKERVVAELTERLRTAETLIVADYRGLTNAELEGLRTELLKHGARFAIVKNTLTRLAAEAAGADALLALLEGPTAIAFVESDGDPVAVAKALGDTARTTRILAVRGGMLEGRSMSADEVESLAKLPPLDVLRGQVLGAVTAPLTAIVGLLSAPLHDLYGLIDARIEQLREQGDTSADEVSGSEPQSPAAQEAQPEQPEPEASAASEEAAEEASGSEPQSPVAEAAPEQVEAEAPAVTEEATAETTEEE